MARGADIRRVVCGVDGSPMSELALRWAVAAAATDGGTVQAVMAWQDPYVLSGWMPTIPVALAEIEDANRRQLLRVVHAVQSYAPDVEIEPLLVQGGARSVLLEIAEGADLLAVGHRELGGVHDTVLGSVARHVVSRAPCPTIVVRGGTEHAPDAPVVAGVDGSAHAEAAVEWAIEEARRQGRRLRLVTAWMVPTSLLEVNLPPAYAKEVADAARQHLEALAATLPDDVEVEVEVAKGSPQRVLERAAEDAALVVVGSRGHGGMASVLLGSVSHHVLSHAACPVVVVPHPKAA